MFVCKSNGCRFCTKSVLAYTSHCNVHNSGPKKLFFCGVIQCSRQFHQYSSFSSHVHRDHQDRNIKCHTSLEQNSVSSFPCTVCERSFVDVDSVKSHVRSHFDGTTQIACPNPGCDKVYRLESSYRAHVSKKHRSDGNTTYQIPDQPEIFMGEGFGYVTETALLPVVPKSEPECDLNATSTLPSTPPSTPSSSEASMSPMHSLSNFTVPFNRFPASLKKLVSEKKRQTEQDKKTLVNFLFDEIYTIEKKPGKPFLVRVAMEVVQKFPSSFREELENGQPIDKGCNKLIRKLEFKFHNANRTKKNNLFPNEENSTTSRKRIIPKDRYGCVNFLPTGLPANETANTLKEKKSWLLQEFLKVNCERDPRKIKQYMKDTYVYQRQIITQKETVTSIRKEWPFLFEKEYLLDHFEELMGFSLFERARAAGEEYVPDVLKYLVASVGPTAIPKEPEGTTIRRRQLIKMHNENHSRDITFVLLLEILAMYWKQDVAQFFVFCEDMVSIDELEATATAPAHPYVAVLGESLASSSHGHAVTEGNATESLPLYEATLLAFGLYYVFSIQYPSELGALLEFIQRNILDIVGEGTKVKRTKNKGCPSFNDRVLTFTTKFEEYRRIWNQK